MAVRLTIHHIDGHREFDSREQRVIRIGRNARAHVQLTDPAVSRLHATIELDSRGAAVLDLGTLAGTHVNGERIGGKQALADGDVVRIGATDMHIGLEPVIVAPIEVPARRRSPTPPPAPPVPDLIDQTVPCRRGVGRDWLARDYVTHEKFDTHFLVAQMQSRRQRSRALTTLALASAVVVFAALPIAVDDIALPEVEIAEVFTSPTPVVEPATIAEPAPAPTHVVQSGDTLGTIAADYLGDAGAWRTVWEANRDRLEDPSLLDVGVVLVLPE